MKHLQTENIYPSALKFEADDGEDDIYLEITLSCRRETLV